jgi:hypothetical protein
MPKENDRMKKFFLTVIIGITFLNYKCSEKYFSNIDKTSELGNNNSCAKNREALMYQQVTTKKGVEFLPKF